ncbi:MAG: hypothetical protein KGH93_01435 [Patescibacteria group bacterium]|nr:hypothetical protein [Patescibacteria group bacterium]
MKKPPSGGSWSQCQSIGYMNRCKNWFLFCISEPGEYSGNQNKVKENKPISGISCVQNAETGFEPYFAREKRKTPPKKQGCFERKISRRFQIA